MAIAAPLAITALKLAWPEQLGYAAPFALYFAAILLGAWTAGLAGGIAASALSALLGSYFFVLPYRSLAPAGADAWLAPAISLLEGVTIGWLMSRLRAAHARARAAFAARQALAAEIEGVLTSVDGGITVQDAHGKLLYANETAAKLTGYPSAAALLAALG